MTFRWIRDNYHLDSWLEKNILAEVRDIVRTRMIEIISLPGCNLNELDWDQVYNVALGE